MDRARVLPPELDDRDLESEHLQFRFHHGGAAAAWRPKRFLVSVAQSVPATGGVLIQFPFYGAIAAILTQAKNSAGLSVSDQIADARC